MNFAIAGRNSDIGKELRSRLEADGGVLVQSTDEKWDLLILCQGSLEPIGKFFDVMERQWEESVYVNAFIPLHYLREAWDQRNPNATVVFLAGPNMAKPSPTYTAYRAGKAIIESLVETLGIEYPETKFRILRPGVVNTKIHQQTLQAGHRAANYERVMRIVNGGEPTVSHDEVYRRLKELL